MATHPLSSDDIAFGRAVLLATDALGMSAEGAFWIYDTRDRKWDFFLVTSLFKTLGSREIYLRLNKALERQLSARETRKFQLLIGAPTESLAKTIRAAAPTDIFVSEPQEVDISLPGEDTKALVYRIAEPSDDRDVRRAKIRFRRLSDEVIAA